MGKGRGEEGDQDFIFDKVYLTIGVFLSFFFCNTRFIVADIDVINLIKSHAVNYLL